ncbi:DeoR/GlpR family DNA-binding transcription regulator [Acidimangrovimonas sediminis]|uniref:DeoR/GlpR family DNA-binding transcription regulator n=1 Tax=Acidimangrovimonas sediminis TaxID=2056283 RepID=UPI000C80816C|nr:DeoR/GlpR family DNA-binding transcription regulator [Acidimangrovimonas sediminis]
MAQNFRHGEILQLARDRGKVVVEDLAQHFGVTLQTIRRDLSELCDTGQLTRVYGGAILASGVANIGYEDRRRLNEEEKDRIGRACAAAIPDEASLFLNIGTTTEAVARALLGHRQLMVVTNNLNVATILAQNPTAEVIVAGGVLRRADAGLVGEMTLEMVRHFKVDFAVIGASALDEEGDLLDFDFREVRVSQAILGQARRRCLVADRSKFSRTAPVRIGSLEAVDSFFTDAPPPPAVVERCAEWGTRIVVAGT